MKYMLSDMRSMLFTYTEGNRNLIGPGAKKKVSKNKDE